MPRRWWRTWPAHSRSGPYASGQLGADGEPGGQDAEPLYAFARNARPLGQHPLRLGVQVFGRHEIEHLLVNQVQVGCAVGPGHQPRATGQGVKDVEVR